MTTLLAKQVAAFRQEHGISSVGPKRTAPPSVLFTPQEAKRHDPEAFAALALHGIEEASLLDPEIASYSSLFEGPQKDRDLMTREENAALDEKIHHLLLLLSPHLQARAAQECLEGLLYRCHVHRWNVDDLLGAALPHHDSPLFTKLVQGLHVEGKPLWSWLATLKAKPATLVRSALAKYCTKDIALLSFVGKVMEENLKLQKANRALMTFYVALWLDTLALLGSPAPELVQALLPTLLLMLRRPSQKDAFHAGLTIAGALCAKVELEASVQSKIISFAARQAKGEEGQPATSLMAAVMQLQAVQGIQSSAVKALAKNGAEELLQALPVGVDCGNLLACVVEAGLGILADASEASGETEALVLGVLRDAVTLRCYAAPLSAAVLQAYMAAIAGISSAKERKRITKVYQEPVQLLGDTVPAALAEAFRWTVDQALALEVDAEPLVNLLAPACAAVPDDGEASEKLVPAVQAFHHKSAKVRSRAVQKAVAELAELPEKGGEGAQERCRLMASLALQVVNDENAEVVAVALKQEALWTSGEVAPSMATAVLSTALRRLLRGVQPKGKNLQELFRSLLQEDSRVRALFPLMIQASAWIYGREDTEQDERKRLDALLLPVLLLAFSGLDAAEEAAGPLQRLEAAAAEFCKVSEEPLLKVPAGGAEAGEAWGARIGAVAQAADAEAAGRLADLAAEESILGGLGSQTAAALALAASLPRLQKKAPQLVTRGATACQRLARLSDSAELRTLWKACVEAAAPGPSGPVRRKSGKSSTASGAGEAPARVLLEVALQRPKVFAADLQLSLQNHAAALRPALLQLALGSGGMEGSPAITANALLLLRSLLASWGADQMMLVLILARLASAEERQVRAAAVALLETLQEVKIAQESGIDALVEERLLLPTASVAPEKVWPSLGQQLPATLWSTLLQRILKQKAELVQDPIAAQNVLQKLLGLKGGLPKTSREQACSFWLVGLARLAPDQAALLTALPGALALRSAQEPLAKTAQWAAKSTTAPALLLAAMSLLLHMAGGAMLSAAEKIRTAAQEAAVEALRQVALPFCLGLAEVCEKAQEAPAWDSSLVHLASRTCAALSKVAGALAAQSVHEEVVAESLKTLFRFSVAVRGLAPAADESGFSSVVATASSALSEAPAKPWLVEMLLQGSEFQGKRLKAASGEVAAEILCEQVASLEASLGEDAAALLRKLGEVVKEAGRQSGGGALVHLLLAMAALAEKLVQAHGEAPDMTDEASAVAGAIPDVCQCIDEVVPKLVESSPGGLAPLLRSCGALAVLASGEAAFSTCTGALRNQVGTLRPDLLALLRGNLRRLWRYPLAEDSTWASQAQVRLRTLLGTLFGRGLIEVSKSNCLALAQSAGVRASLDFIVVQLLVYRLAHTKPTPKRRKRKRRAEPDELEEEIDALTAPTSEDLMLDEALEVLQSVDPGSMYHCLGMLLLTLSAWAVDLRGGTRLSWSELLLPEEAAAELDEDVRLKVLSRGFLVVARFLSEYGLPADLDREEVDTSTLPDFTAEGGDEDVGAVAALALCHGARAVCIAEAAVQGLEESKEQALCLQRAAELRGLLLRSLAVNHPATFFRSLCLTLGVKGAAPKAQALLSDKEFAGSLAITVLSGSADALHVRRDLRNDDEDEGMEAPGEACAALCESAVQHISKRFLAGDAEDSVVTKAWTLLDSICRFAKTHASTPLVQLVLPQAGARLKAASGRLTGSGAKVAIACCQCVDTVVNSLGRNIIEKLNDLVPPLLDLAMMRRASNADTTALLDQHILGALGSLARRVGSFLSPFLSRFLEVTCSGPAARVAALQDLAHELVAGVPHRLLLMSVQEGTVKPFDGTEESLTALDEKLLHMQRLASFHIWILSKASPEFVAGTCDAVMASLLRLLAISSDAVSAFLQAGMEPDATPSRALRRGNDPALVDEAVEELSWEQFGSQPSMWQLHHLAAAAFAQFALRLEEEELKTRFVKVLEWARGKQPKLLEQQRVRKAKDFDSIDPVADATAACRVMALTSTMGCIAEAAPGIAGSLLLPLGTKDLSTALVACRRFALQTASQKARKRRKTSEKAATSKEVLQENTWWWHDVACSCLDFLAAACKPSEHAGLEAKPFADAAEELREPVANLLDIFEFLSQDSSVAPSLRAALEAAAVALCNVANEGDVKLLVQAILEKSRSEDAEVRLNAVRCAHRIWTDLGVQVVVCLSEVTMYASELLEDEDSRVEMAVRAMIKTMEDCTGESLQDTLKS